MLTWLTSKNFNRVDVTWIVFIALALFDRHYIYAAVFVIVGPALSVLLERKARQRRKELAVWMNWPPG